MGEEGVKGEGNGSGSGAVNEAVTGADTNHPPTSLKIDATACTFN